MRYFRNFRALLAVIGAALLFASLFMPWYQVSAEVNSSEGLTTINAWKPFQWLATYLLVAAATVFLYSFRTLSGVLLGQAEDSSLKVSRAVAFCGLAVAIGLSLYCLLSPSSIVENSSIGGADLDLQVGPYLALTSSIFTLLVMLPDLFQMQRPEKEAVSESTDQNADLMNL